MNLPKRILQMLGSAIAGELSKADPGHCVRVDHMGIDESIAACEQATAHLQPECLAYVVVPDAPTGDPVRIRPERAIELRNRKQVKLCIFIPAGTRDAAASSLSNSFAVFDLQAFLKRVRDELLGQIPPLVTSLVRQAIAAMPKTTGSALESVVEYVGAVVDHPTANGAGTELWRLGLIPDGGGETFADRLADNKRCAQILTRPPRAQMSVSERVGLLGLREGAVRDELHEFLEGRRLRDARGWLMVLNEPTYLSRISFESWVFEKAESSDLESIDIIPFLDSAGVIRKETHLSQPNGVGTPPTASVGPKSKVTIQWECTPKAPVNLKRWRVELVPSREEYSPEEVAGVELPLTTVAAKTRKASVKLDIDLASCPVKVVQARIVGLDEFGAELRCKGDTHDL